MDEVSRDIIREAREKGTENLFLSSPILFSEILLKKRIKQYDQAEKEKKDTIFFDRGIIDIVAYLNFSKSKHTIDFNSPLKTKKYDFIFICPPWESIYTKDNERYESFQEAKKIHNELISSYNKEGYNPINIAPGTLEERTEFILKTLSL